MPSLKELSQKKDLLSPGHRLCAGCGESIAVRQILLAADRPVVVANATGCLEVGTTIFPYTAWRTSWIHSAFNNTAASLSGVEAAYNALRRRGKIKEEFCFIAFAGDGGTYDIGFQALSGALERGHRMLFVCLDNEAYMNTGIQRSSSTPFGAWTTTSPVGREIVGKREYKKDLTAIVADHHIPYVAQATPTYFNDLIKKVQKALSFNGPSFINVLVSCNRGWRHNPNETIEIQRLAVQTCYWPLFEVEEGKWRLTYKPKEKIPLIEYLQKQGRFRHLLTEKNKPIVEELQKEVDRKWEELLKRCEGDKVES